MGSEPPLPLISVVITVKNEEPHLPQLLDSLLVQEAPFEVIVVDAVSRDRTLEVAQEYARRRPDLVRVLERSGSRGVGRNVGVAVAHGTWVAFIDGDCFADSQWLAAMRRALRQSPVVAGRTVVVGKSNYGQLERVELFESGYDVTFPSCNLAYHRSLFQRLGGFDTRFVTAEDIDLNLRAVEAGASIRYEPQAVVYHHVRTTFIRFLYQAFWNGYGRKQLTEKQGNLWGRYRYRRLLRGQRSGIAWARLTAAMTGYFFRVFTGGGRRLDLERRVTERMVPATDDGGQAGPNGD